CMAVRLFFTFHNPQLDQSNGQDYQEQNYGHRRGIPHIETPEGRIVTYKENSPLFKESAIRSPTLNA
ncbi:MAG: hypothetical protein RQ801_11205, partial [Spirochaetaceae bacterium]|nr:hypothetical protein [Spirochaetaceae bacterium]